MSKTHENPAAQAEVGISILQAFTNAGMFAAKDVKPDSIELPDGTQAHFYVRELPDAQFRAIYSSNNRAKLIATTICDEDGKAVMTEKQAGELKPRVADQLQTIALRHSGFGPRADEDQDEAGNE